MTATMMSHALKLDTASFARTEGSEFSDKNQTDSPGSKRSRSVEVGHWRPGMGLADDYSDLPAAKRATLANISLLYQSLEVR